MSNIKVIKSIRAKTSLSFKDIKKAVEKLNTSDEDKIIKHLREQGSLKMEKRQDRQTSEGFIFTYVHEGRVGVMLEIRSETDFVSRGEAFQQLGKDVALHIAAMQPKFIKAEEMDAEFVKKEMEIAKVLLEKEGKPAEIIDKILAGKERKLAQEVCLLEQSFLKDTKITVEQYLMQVSQTVGEKLEITRFTTYTL